MRQTEDPAKQRGRSRPDHKPAQKLRNATRFDRGHGKRGGRGGSAGGRTGR